MRYLINGTRIDRSKEISIRRTYHIVQNNISRTAAIENVSRNTVYKCVRRGHKRRGRVKGSGMKATRRLREILHILLSVNPLVYLYEIKCFLSRRYNVVVSESYLSKFLKQEGFRRKRVSPISVERISTRVRFMRTMTKSIFSIIPDYCGVVFIDESHVSRRDLQRRYGRMIGGGELLSKTQQMRGERFPILAALGYNEILYFELVSYGVNDIKFEAFMTNLLNFISPRSILFLDNAPIHKTQSMLEFYTIHNLQVLFNAPYSPEWNAIELVFNVIKTMLKKHFSTSEPMKRIVYEILYYKLDRRICNNIVDHTFQRWFSIEP